MKSIPSQKQFKPGYVPNQPVAFEDNAQRTEAGSPSKQRKRKSVALGFETQANPGLAGYSDFGERKGKRK